MPVTLKISRMTISYTFSLREDFKKSDIVTYRSGTYLPYQNSDIKISDICLKIYTYLPQGNSDAIFPKLFPNKTLFVQNQVKICTK